MKDVLHKKIGKFKAWQLALMGGGIGLFLYERNKQNSGATSETPVEGLAKSTNNPLAGENGLGGFGGGSPEQIPGAPGEPGAPGAPGVEQFTPKQVEQLDDFLNRQNNPPPVKKSPAPQASRFTQTNSKGEKFYTEHSKGKITHVYKNKKVVVAAGKRIAHPNPHHKRTHAGGGGVRAISHARPKPASHPKAKSGAPKSKPKVRAKR